MVVSSVLLLIGIFSVFVHGKLNLGIDFAGGTQLNIKFNQPPAVEELRSGALRHRLSDLASLA